MKNKHMNLSIIIPTLNEADYLAATVETLRQNSRLGNSHEVIVIDSGSTDETVEIANKLGTKLIKSESSASGRAYVLNEAAGFASGDILLFLDADTLVPAGYDKVIDSVLSNPGVVGGAFEFALDGSEFALRVVELINRVRYRIRQRYYGDQGIFVRADVFRRAGGYPAISILEAAHFCKKLRKYGKLKLIKKDMKTSPRRFIEGGVYRVLLSDIKIWFLDLLGISVDKYAQSYWKENKLRSKD